MTQIDRGASDSPGLVGRGLRRFAALDRGWRAAALGVAIVLAHVLVG